MKTHKWKNIIRKEIIDQDDYVDWDDEEKIIKKYAKTIGSFLISFNVLEYELNLTISHFFCDDAVHEGYLVTKDLMFRNKVELFNNLFLAILGFSTKKEIGLKKLKYLYKKLTEINIFRNYVIHANWLTLDKDNFVRTKLIIDTEGGYIKGKKIKITPGTIRKKENEIKSIINQLDKIEEYVWI